MDQSQDYVIHSLEQHLFFARIMKEHALFLKLGFLPPNQNLAQDAEHFLREFEALLSRAIAFSNRVVRNCVLLLAAMVVVINFIVDVLYAAIDPRIEASDV